MDKLRLAIPISGNGTNLQSLIDSCSDQLFPAKIVIVLSNNPQAKGLLKAGKAGIETMVIEERCFGTQSQYDAELSKIFKTKGIDLICLAGFMRLLSKSFCTMWHNKLINIHPSLLPAFKGLNAPKQAFDAGARFSGCSVHYVRPKIDSGPVIIQAVVPIMGNDTLKSITMKILEEEHRIYPEAIRLIADKKLNIQNGKVVITNHNYHLSSITNPTV